MSQIFLHENVLVFLIHISQQKKLGFLSIIIVCLSRRIFKNHLSMKKVLQ